MFWSVFFKGNRKGHHHFGGSLCAAGWEAGEKPAVGGEFLKMDTFVVFAILGDAYFETHPWECVCSTVGLVFNPFVTHMSTLCNGW